MRVRTSSLIAVLAVGAFACGKGESGSDSGKAPARIAAHNNSTMRIAVIAKSSTNPVFLAARTGAEAAAKELGDKNHMHIDIMWLTPPDEDAQVQRRVGPRPEERLLVEDHRLAQDAIERGGGGDRGVPQPTGADEDDE